MRKFYCWAYKLGIHFETILIKVTAFDKTHKHKVRLFTVPTLEKAGQ